LDIDFNGLYGSCAGGRRSAALARGLGRRAEARSRNREGQRLCAQLWRASTSTAWRRCSKSLRLGNGPAARAPRPPLHAMDFSAEISACCGQRPRRRRAQVVVHRARDRRLVARPARGFCPLFPGDDVDDLRAALNKMTSMPSRRFSYDARRSHLPDAEGTDAPPPSFRAWLRLRVMSVPWGFRASVGFLHTVGGLDYTRRCPSRRHQLAPGSDAGEVRRLARTSGVARTEGKTRYRHEFTWAVLTWATAPR
jgi:hypothetical protein